MQEDFDQLASMVRQNLACLVTADVTMRSIGPVLYTDASGYGWGAVLFVNGELPRPTGGKWPANFLNDTNINAAEAVAVAIAIRHFAQNIANRHILLLVDNTSVEAALHRQPHNVTLSLIVAEIDDMLETIDSTMSVAWVPTAENVADAPSRGVQISSYTKILPVDQIFQNTDWRGGKRRRAQLTSVGVAGARVPLR